MVLSESGSPQLRLRLGEGRRRPRVLDGHPWVYAGEVEGDIPQGHDGEAVVLEDKKGNLLGTGVLNSRSKIVWRRFSREVEAWNGDLLSRRIQAALARRSEEEAFQRLVFSEADDLPGLVVDRFSDVCVVQILTAGVEHLREEVVTILKDLVACQEVVFRNDAPTRELEGLESYVATASGRPHPAGWYQVFDIWYWLDLMEGQKTGFYLDQRYEHFKVATFAEGWRVLDAFCNQGAFALNAAQAGAREVIGIDVSSTCIAAARKNAERNELTVDFQEANVFDYFTENRGERFDLIVLDPPSFARNKRSLQAGLRGYKELNLRALRMLEPGGILATYSCSMHVGRETFLSMLEEAARDARRVVQRLYLTEQPLDHPIRFGFAESEYLKGAILRVE